MMCAWVDFYKDRILSAGYRDYVRKRYEPFVNEILSNIKDGDRIVEVGCGLATITSLIADTKSRPFSGFRCYDLSPEMVSYARLNLHEGYPVELGDARVPTGRYPDIVHSHGLLEHFSDEDIRAVIAAEKSDGARVAIHYVPGEKYETPSFGDERLMSLKAWSDIARPTHSYAFNDGYDYVLKWVF